MSLQIIYLIYIYMYISIYTKELAWNDQQKYSCMKMSNQTKPKIVLYFPNNLVR